MKRLKEISDFYNLMTETDAIYEIIQKQSGLSDAEFWCFSAIRLDGCRFQHQISDLLHMNKQTVNAALRQLVRKGHLMLSAPPENQRVKVISLTIQGIAFAKEHIDVMAELENTAWKKLDQEEKKQLYEATSHYNQHLLEAVRKKFSPEHAV